MKKTLIIAMILLAGPAEARGIFCAAFGVCMTPEQQRRVQAALSHMEEYDYTPPPPPHVPTWGCSSVWIDGAMRNVCGYN